MAEIQAATLAICQAGELGIKKLRLFTDSKVVYDAATNLIVQWRGNNWRSLYDGEPLVNAEEFQQLQNAMRRDQMKIEFEWIRSHSGNQYHNQADHLAKQGAQLHRNYSYH